MRILHNSQISKWVLERDEDTENRSSFLEQHIKHKILRNKKTVITFLDFKKVHDSIDRQTLERVLKNRGLNGLHEN